LRLSAQNPHASRQARMCATHALLAPGGPGQHGGVVRCRFAVCWFVIDHAQTCPMARIANSASDLAKASLSLISQNIQPPQALAQASISGSSQRISSVGLGCPRWCSQDSNKFPLLLCAPQGLVMASSIGCAGAILA
jgi:hypothetical protein